jgi:hypothetical protein
MRSLSFILFLFFSMAGCAQEPSEEQAAATPEESSINPPVAPLEIPEQFPPPEPARATSNAEDLGIRAFELAGKTDNPELKRVYLINALNHDPTHMAAVKALLDMVHQDPTNRRLRNEIRSVLELSLFQVKPDDVSKLAGWINELDMLDAQDSAQQQYAEVDYAAEYQMLQATYHKLFSEYKEGAAFDNEIEAAFNTVQEYLELLNLIPLDGSDQTLREKIKSEMNSLEENYNVALILRKLNTYVILLGKDEADGILTSEVSKGRFLAASSVIPGLWEYDQRSLPSGLKSLFDGTVASIKSYENKINKAESLAVKKKIDARFDMDSQGKNDLAMSVEHPCSSGDSQHVSVGPLEQRKERLSQCLNLVYAELDKVKDPKVTMAINNEYIQPIGQVIVEIQRKQYSDYQTWASERLYEAWRAMKVYGDWSRDDPTNISLNGKEVNCILRQKRLWEIDLSIASPEVADAYRQIVSELLNELEIEEQIMHKVIFMKGGLELKKVPYYFDSADDVTKEIFYDYMSFNCQTEIDPPMLRTQRNPPIIQNGDKPRVTLEDF